MRGVHADIGFRGAHNPRVRDDLRGRMGVVLPMDRKAAERPLGQARSQARCVVHTVPRDSDEGPMSKLRAMLNVFKRVDALEARMDGMAEWLEGRK